MRAYFREGWSLSWVIGSDQKMNEWRRRWRLWVCLSGEWLRVEYDGLKVISIVRVFGD